MEDQCPPKQYLDTTYAICKRNEFSPSTPLLNALNTNSMTIGIILMIIPKQKLLPRKSSTYLKVTVIVIIMKPLLSIAELLNIYFKRTRKNYYDPEIYKQFPLPDDFATYLDNTIEFFPLKKERTK